MGEKVSWQGHDAQDGHGMFQTFPAISGTTKCPHRHSTSLTSIPRMFRSFRKNEGWPRGILPPSKCHRGRGRQFQDRGCIPMEHRELQELERTSPQECTQIYLEDI